ncbi:ATP-binding protein [Lichenifustis flavocetrariae]|uniref:histidine kinase n=1 Tax=Lichenifustis flavocetrariae TaxID=2949735 RepID=A0AA42CNR4_9HYPH|nr:ATP-binding protein [Lichenifustis flavocetrariae]MCW6513081.1 ATP-binding protein [Lichenifustis flavocetrariae]
MNSLRVRIAAVLLASIALVMCLATLAAVLVGRRNGAEHAARSIAAQISYFGHLAQANPDQAFETKAPVTGASLVELQADLTTALHRAGDDWQVIVVEPKRAAQPVASVEIVPSHWVTLPIPDLGPPADAWLVLGGWMSLILLGTAAVSLAVAQRVTRPLLLLEEVSARIGTRGELDHVPEEGPAEVRATARALNRLSRNLHQAVESRMRLVAAAGHDLRTPLTRMRLRAEFLDEVERGKWLNNLDELERIADSAIALVREQSGDHGCETIRLDTMLGSIAEDLAALQLPVVCDAKTIVTIKGPPLALTRAFRNLVSNAATHGGGALVTVREIGGRAIVSIEDDGPGIPDAVIGRVFEPFFRVDQSRRQTIPGAGLGLAIAQEIIQRAGGDLTLGNKPQGGLRQCVTFQCCRRGVPAIISQNHEAKTRGRAS